VTVTACPADAVAVVLDVRTDRHQLSRGLQVDRASGCPPNLMSVYSLPEMVLLAYLHVAQARGSANLSS
jgi:hypothetical protein